METKKKHPVPTSISQVRKRFYENASRETGYSEEKIREILKASFGEVFERSKVSEYMKLLKAHKTDDNLALAMKRERSKLRNRVLPVPEPLPCPIEGCGGVMVAGRPWRWVCSEGGLRHYLATTSSYLAGTTPNQMLAKMEARAEETRLRDERVLKAWQEGVHAEGQTVSIEATAGVQVPSETRPAEDVGALRLPAD